MRTSALVDQTIFDVLKNCISSVLIPGIGHWDKMDQVSNIEICLIDSIESYSKKLKGNLFKIEIGLDAIHTKFIMNQAAQSRSSIEVLERGYFDTKLTPYSALAAMVLHEFAHICTFINGRYNAGDFHDNYFYKVLDRLHSSSLSRRFYSMMSHELEELGFECRFNNGNYWYPKKLAGQIRDLSILAEVVIQYGNGVTLNGYIKDIQDKSFIVRTSEGDFEVPKYGVIEVCK